MAAAGIDEILDLEKISRGNGSFFSISSWRIEFSFLEMFSNVKILKKKFSFSSRNSRFGKKFSFSSRRNEILQTDSLSLLDSSLNFSSNSREKSYFPLWVDFDDRCFAKRESILKRRPRAFSGREWLPSGKGKCKTYKNEIGDWLGWRVRTRGGGEEIDFFIVFDIGYNKMDNYCTARLMIIALWWWYCQTHNLYSGFERQNSSCGEDLILRF